MKLKLPQALHAILLASLAALATNVANAADKTPSSLAVTLSSADRLYNAGNVELTQSGAISLTGLSVIQGATADSKISITGAISGSYGLSIQGTTVTFKNSNLSYTGVTTIYANAALSIAFSGNLNRSIVKNTGSTTDILYLDNATGITLGSSTNIDVSNLILAPGITRSLVNQAGGSVKATTMVLSAGTSTGTYNLTSGTLDVGTLQVLGNTSPLTRANFTMTGGTLKLGAGGINSISGATGVGVVKLAGGTLESTASSVSTANITLADNATIKVNSGHNMSLNGIIDGIDGNLIKTGTGTLTLGAANTFRGVATVSEGTLRLTNNLALNGTTSITVSSGASLEVNASSLFTYSNRTITNNGTLTFTSQANVNMVNKGVVNAYAAGSTIHAATGTTGSFNLAGGVNFFINTNRGASTLNLTAMTVTAGTSSTTSSTLNFDVGGSASGSDSIATTNFTINNRAEGNQVILQINPIDSGIAQKQYYYLIKDNTLLDEYNLNDFLLKGIADNTKYTAGINATGYYIYFDDVFRKITWSGGNNGNWSLDGQNWMITSADDTKFVNGDEVHFTSGTNSITLSSANICPYSISVTGGTQTFKSDGVGTLGSSLVPSTAPIFVNGATLIMDASMANKVHTTGSIYITNGTLRALGENSLGTGHVNLHTGSVLEVGANLKNLSYSFDGGQLKFTNNAQISGRLSKTTGNDIKLEVASGVTGSLTGAYTVNDMVHVTGVDKSSTLSITQAFLYGGLNINSATLSLGALSGIGGVLTLNNSALTLQNGAAITALSNIIVKGDSSIDFGGRVDTHANLRLDYINVDAGSTLTLKNVSTINVGNIGSATSQGTIKTENFTATGNWMSSYDTKVSGNTTIGSKLILAGGTYSVGAGTLTVAATTSDAINITAGTLKVGETSSAGAHRLNISSGGMTVRGGGTAHLTTGAELTTNAISLNSNSGTCSNYKQDAGQLIIGSGGITHSGDGEYSIKLNGGTIKSSSNWGSTLNMEIGENSSQKVCFESEHEVNLSGKLTGSGSLEKTGSGNLTLAGNNSFSGGTSIKSGTVTAKDTNALGTGNVHVAAGASIKAENTAIGNDITLAAADGSKIAKAHGGDQLVFSAGSQSATISGSNSSFGNNKIENATVCNGTLETGNAEIKNTTLDKVKLKNTGTTTTLNNVTLKSDTEIEDGITTTLGDCLKVSGSFNKTETNFSSLEYDLGNLKDKWTTSGEHVLYSSANTLNTGSYTGTSTGLTGGSKFCNYTWAQNGNDLAIKVDCELTVTSVSYSAGNGWQFKLDSDALTFFKESDFEGNLSFSSDAMKEFLDLRLKDTTPQAITTFTLTDGDENCAVDDEDKLRKIKINNVKYDDDCGYNVDYIPEPSTATLSLLALTALLARRRRKA